MQKASERERERQRERERVVEVLKIEGGGRDGEKTWKTNKRGSKKWSVGGVEDEKEKTKDRAGGGKNEGEQQRGR